MTILILVGTGGPRCLTFCNSDLDNKNICQESRKKTFRQETSHSDSNFPLRLENSEFYQKISSLADVDPQENIKRIPEIVLPESNSLDQNYHFRKECTY